MQEHVLLDGDEGLSLQVLTLNLGISGIRGSLQELASLLQQKYSSVALAGSSIEKATDC
jgi:hypothetical protein